MKKFAKMALAAAIAGFSFAASANLVIDDFEVDQGLGAILKDITPGSAGKWNSATGATTSILGGERDIFVRAITTDGDVAGVTASVGGGLLKYSTDELASGRSFIKWDGSNSTTGSTVQDGTEDDFFSTMDYSGLNNFKLADTGSAFLINVNKSDLGFDFSISVYTSSSRWTTLVLQSESHAIGDPASSPIQFADFLGSTGWVGAPGITAYRIVGADGAADMNDVGAILATINFSGDELEIDLSLKDVGTVPEPEGLALVGLGLLGLAASRRRKNVTAA